MKSIPIKAAEHIAKEYGYDEIIIVSCKVGPDPNQQGGVCYKL